MNRPERTLRADARRNREAILDAAAALFAQHGGDVQMEDIAAAAGVGVGTLYRHFVDKRTLRAAIIGRRFATMTALAEEAEQLDEAWAAFTSLLDGYLAAAEPDAAFRLAILGPEEPAWRDIEAEKRAFSAVVERIVRRAVDAGALRADFRADDFILITRGAMANMTGTGDWRRHLALQLDGIAAAAPGERPPGQAGAQ